MAKQKIIAPAPNRITRLPSGAYLSDKNIDRYHADGWVNILTGLGMGNDKQAYGMVLYKKLVEVDVETLYAADPMSARLCDILPQAAMRKGIDFQGLEEEQEYELQELLQNIRFKNQVTDLLVWGKLYGGAGLMMGTDEMEDLTVPLDPTTVENVLSLTLMTRYELYPSQLQYDPMKKNFGYPEYYRLQLRGASPVNGHEIHHSRIVRGEGVPLPRRLHIQNQYWGDSVLSRLYDVLRSYNMTNKSIGSVIQDFRVGIFKLKNLADMVAMGQDGLIQKRLALVDAAKSVNRSVVLDADSESFEQASGTMNGVKDLIDSINDALVAATGIPITVLFGRSPQGLGGSGRHEETNWYDMVTAYQEDEVRPVIKKIVETILLTRNSPTGGEIPKAFGFTFNPLWALDETELADIRLKQAQADALYIENGAVTPEEIALSRFGGEEWDAQTKIDLTIRRQLNTQGNQTAPPGSQTTNETNPNPATGEELNVEKGLLDSPKHLPPVQSSAAGQVLPRSGALATIQAGDPKDDAEDTQLNYNPAHLEPESTANEALPRTDPRSYSPSGQLLNVQNDSKGKAAKRSKFKSKNRDHDSSLVVEGKLNPQNDPRQFSPTEMYYSGGARPAVKNPAGNQGPQKDYFYQQEIPAPLARDIATPPGTSTVSPSEPLTPRPADAPAIAKLKVPGQTVDGGGEGGTSAIDPVHAIIVSKEHAATKDQARELAKQHTQGQEIQSEEESGTSYRFHIRSAGDFEPGTLKTFKVRTQPGVSVLFGKAKANED